MLSVAGKFEEVMHIRSYRIISIFISLFFSAGIMWAQEEAMVSLQIEDKFIPAGTYRQFLQIHDPERLKPEKENLRDYLAYQLKIYEAGERRYDTLKKFRNEMSLFRDMYTDQFLDFDRLDEKILREYYRRILTEREISHLRIDIDGDLYKDTLDEYILVDSIRELVVRGADFNVIAARYSDAQTSVDSGYLGYITGMETPFPLEEMAYNTDPGNVSEVFRTSGSYHLVFVHQEIPSRGTVIVSNIFKKAGSGLSETEHLAIQHELDSLKILAEEGVDFPQLSRTHSDRLGKEEIFVELPPIRSRGKNPELAQAAFELKHDGEISQVVKTRKGYYVLKRLEYIPVQDYRSVKSELSRYYGNNPTRKNYLHDRFLRNVLNYYGFNFYQEAYDDFVPYGRYAFKKGKWIEPEDLDRDRIIFEIGDHPITYQDFSGYLSQQQFAYDFINYPPVVGKHFQDFFLEEVVDYQKQHLEARYPRVDSVMLQYRNTLFIQMIEDEILKNASNDTRGLKKQFTKNKEKYSVQGFEGVIIQFTSMRDRQKLEYEINNLDSDTESLQESLKKYGDAITTQEVTVYRGENDIVDHFIWKQSKFQPGYSLILVKGQKIKLPARNYREALTEVIIDHAEACEKKYIRSLKRKYKTKLKIR